MASFLSRLQRTLPSLHRHRQHNHRNLSILSPDSKTPLTSIEKSRAALLLLKSETNPERIIDICRAASLTPESHLDRTAFSLAISKLVKSNYYEGIRLFLDELKTRPDLVNERFAAHSIVLYGQAGMLNNAIKSFEEIDQLGLSRSVKSLNALLFSCIVAKNHKEVTRIFYEFPKKYNIEPDLVTYNTVIKAFCESGMSNSVYSILAEMDRKRCKPNATSYGTLIAGLYKEEKFGDVGKVLEIMKRNGTHPGVSTYNIRIKSLCILKKASEAKALLEEMFSHGMKPNSVTYVELIHGFCKEKKLDEAKKLYKNMVNRGLKPESVCYFTLIYYLCEGGDFEAALQMCKDSMEKNWVPNFSTMKSLVNGLVSIDKVAEAKELVGQVNGKKFTRNADMWNEIEATLPQ